jgi:hypothetical protein
VLGSLDGLILFYSIATPEQPIFVKSLNLGPYNLTCMKLLSQKILLCGQERGYLTVVDCAKYTVASEGKIEHKEDKSHVNAITKTADKGLYVIATNKGLALVRINDKNNAIMVQKQYF